MKHWLKRKVPFTQALLVAFLITGGIGFAANLASNETNIQIGKGATLQNIQEGNGAVVIGENAKIDSYVNQPGSIAIGKNALVENMAGRQESYFSFGQTTFTPQGFWGNTQIPADASKLAGSIAIGDNTFARSGSIMIGSHNYRGKLGDVDNIDTSKTREYDINVNATTLGTNSFNQGAFSSIVGAYSIITGKYNGSGFSSSAGQNFGSVINGALNSIESKTASSNYSGVANAIVGTANRTFNSNGSLIFGAGNEITNSVKNISTPTDAKNSAKELSDKLREAVKTSESGGATLAIGGGNKADYAIASQLIGVNNTLTGASGNISKFNLVNGYKNTSDKTKYVTVIGTENTVTGGEHIILMGDKHKLTKVNNSVVLGSMDTKKEMAVSEAVSIGHNAHVEVEGGVSLGSNSVADRDKGKVGYDALNEKHDEDMTGTWKSTAAALSVGEKDKTTRQITNVAAGTEDTDAVNVAQLKALNQKMDKNTIHYVSVKSNEKGADSNYFNDGAKEKDSIVVGIHSTSSGVNSAVFGNHVKLTGVKNGRNNSIVVGHHIGAEGTHNAIFATDYHNYDHKTTHVFGEANTVLGVGNLVGWTAEKDSSDPTKWIYTKKGSGSDQNVAVGLTNTVNGGSIVVGTSSTSESLGSSFGHGNTIIGMDNDGGQRGLALGNDLKVKGEEAVAIGTESEATSDWTIAVGKKSKAEKTQDMAMGYQATASGGWSIAFGGSSSAEKQTALALGYGSHAKVDGGIALGSFSIADRAGFDSMKEAPYSNFNLADKTLGAVSVGGNGKLRQIINVGDATEETDAVNLRQLNALKNTVSEISQLNFAGDNNSTGSVNLATETLKLSGSENQITTKAEGNGLTIALDKKVTDKLDSIGTGKVEKGDTNTVTGDTVYHAIKEQIDDVEKGDITSNTLSITGGAGKVFGEDVSIELKEKSVTKVHLSEEVTNILDKVGDGVIAKDGEKSEHTVTGKTVYEYLKQQKEEIGVDLSKKANKDASNIEVDKFTEKLNEGANIAEPTDRLVTDRQVKDYVDGIEIAYRAEGESDSKKVKLSDGFVFQGDNNIQTETESNGVVKHTLNSELTGIKSISNEGTTITLNKENVAVNDKKITGVADGDISATSRDAVNGRQLHETNGRVERLEKDSETMKEHIVENTRQIEHAKSETRHVGALSSALAALHPMQYDPLQKNQVMAGVGTYRDKQAVAVGVTHYFNENLMMTAGVSVGEAERVKTMANVGITWKIGKDDDRKDLPERYKEGPISSIYKMQQEMEEVLKENREQKTQIQKQQEQINKMQEQLEMLLKQK